MTHRAYGSAICSLSYLDRVLDIFPHLSQLGLSMTKVDGVMEGLLLKRKTRNKIRKMHTCHDFCDAEMSPSWRKSTRRRLKRSERQQWKRDL